MVLLHYLLSFLELGLESQSAFHAFCLRSPLYTETCSKILLYCQFSMGYTHQIGTFKMLFSLNSLFNRDTSHWTASEVELNVPNW